MAKIALTTLQQKYPGKIVILTRDETKVVMAVGSFAELRRELDRKHMNLADCVVVGPVARNDTVQI